MQKVGTLASTAGFIEVLQDKQGIVARRSGGLYTRNLMNCVCVILSDDNHTAVGMIHLNPTNENLSSWIEALRKETGATQAIVTGANVEEQSEERRTELLTALAGLLIIDETKSGWLARGGEGGCKRGNNTSLVGYAAVNAGNGNYALSIFTPAMPAGGHAPAAASSRRSACGGCTIM